MKTDLIPMFDLDHGQPWWNKPSILYPPTNEFDENINDSNNRTSIEIARRVQRIQKIQAGKETLLAAIHSNPGKATWELDVLGEEKGIFRRQPKIMSIRIK